MRRSCFPWAWTYRLTRVFLDLRRRGLDVPPVYTMEQAVAVLSKYRGGGKMLKDITLGQYFPGNSVVHRLDPRTKLLLRSFISWPSLWR